MKRVVLLLFALFTIILLPPSAAAAAAAASAASHVSDENICSETVLQFSVSGCERLRGGPQQIPDRQYWIKVRDEYVKAVGKEFSTIMWPLVLEDDDDDDDDDDYYTTAQPPPFSGMASSTIINYKYAPGKGRGVYASTPIPKHTKVWDGKYYHAIFPTECSFKTFLSNISWEQACDALQWCYGYQYDDSSDDDDDDDDYVSEGNSNIGVGCCLDEGSLFNHGGSASTASNNENNMANVGYLDALGSDEVSTLRDIDEGEELLQDYGSFEVHVEWFDDLMRTAWGDGDGEDGEWEEYYENLLNNNNNNEEF